MSYNNKKSNIIQKAIENTIQYENVNLKSSMGIWSSFKTNFYNKKNTITYNIVNRGTYFDFFSFNYVNIFNSSFYLKNDEGKKKFNEKIDRILYFSYRKNYPIQINYKNKSEYTSDCGWGCMIRSSQMLLARAIYKILKKTNTPERAFKLTLYYFFEYPINESSLPFCLSHYYNKLKNELNLNEQINKKIFSPFSIKNICSIGEIYGKTCGEWFSDVNLPHIFDIINLNMNVIPNLKVINFTSCVLLKNLIEKCFKIPNSIITVGNNNLEYINFNDEQYILENSGLIFISVRLGIYNISEEYYFAMKKLYSCKEFLGFVGGKNNAASYFIGFNEKNMIYLDPHYSQDSIVPPIDDNNIKSYSVTNLYQIPFENLQPAFTMGFLFTNILEFNDMINFFIEHNKLKFSCFSFQIDNYSLKINSSFINNSSMNRNDF